MTPRLGPARHRIKEHLEFMNLPGVIALRMRAKPADGHVNDLPGGKGVSVNISAVRNFNQNLSCFRVKSRPGLTDIQGNTISKGILPLNL